MKNRISTQLTRLLVVLFVAIWNALPAEATNLFIDPSPKTVTEGETFTIDIRIDEVADLYAFQFDLGFDPGILSANGIAEGAFLLSGGPTLFIPGTIDNTAGTILETANALNGAVPGVDGSGVLATMSFIALASGSSSINLFNPILLDSSGSDIAVTGMQNGSVNVTPSQNNAPVPEPLAFVMMGIGLTGLMYSRRQRASRL